MDSAWWLRILVGAGLVLSSSCRERAATPLAETPSDTWPETDTPRLQVPTFQLQISLTPEAAKTLAQAHESIAIAAYFDGDGRKRYPGENTAPFRAVFLGQRRKELWGEGVVTFDDAFVSKEAFTRLSDTNYYYTINVVSGRRSFPHNLLRCPNEPIDRHISEATHPPTEPLKVTCDLLPRIDARGPL